MPQRDPERYQPNLAGSSDSEDDEAVFQPGSPPKEDADTDSKDEVASSGDGSEHEVASSGELFADEVASSGDLFADAEGDGPEIMVPYNQDDEKINFSKNDEESPSRAYSNEEVAAASTREHLSRVRRGDDTSSDRQYLAARFWEDYSRVAEEGFD